MSARTKTKSVLDAEVKRLRTLIALGGGGGELLPLSRTVFVDGGAVSSGQNGSIAEPFHTITKALPGAGTSVADSTAMFLVEVMPCLNGYTENVALPAGRVLELLSPSLSANESPYCIDGNITLANSGAAHPAAAPFYPIHNLSCDGTFTVTDAAGAITSEIFLSADFSGVLSGLLTATGAQGLLFVGGDNFTFASGVTSTTGATGASIDMTGGLMGGTVTCKAFAAISTTITATAINVGSGGDACDFALCTFQQGQNPVITGLAGSSLLFDGYSYKTFLEAGGTVVTSVVLVVGGYASAAVEGANLTNADVNVSLNGTGASIGFTAGGNHYTLPAATLTGNHAVTLKTGGGELAGDVIRITRTDATANTYTIKNNAGATLAVLPASHEGFVEARFVGGGDWAFAGGGAI